jgi:hypothetical protein
MDTVMPRDAVACPPAIPVVRITGSSPGTLRCRVLCPMCGRWADWLAPAEVRRPATQRWMWKHEQQMASRAVDRIRDGGCTHLDPATAPHDAALVWWFEAIGVR